MFSAFRAELSNISIFHKTEHQIFQNSFLCSLTAAKTNIQQQFYNQTSQYIAILQ